MTTDTKPRLRSFLTIPLTQTQRETINGAAEIERLKPATYARRVLVKDAEKTMKQGK